MIFISINFKISIYFGLIIKFMGYLVNNKLTTLFGCLCWVLQCAKILEMSENGKKKQIFFVAELVLLLICVRCGSDCHDVVASISIQLEKVSRALMEGDVVARDEQRKFGAQFVEAFQEVAFHSNNCLLGQLKLIGNRWLFVQSILPLVRLKNPLRFLQDSLCCSISHQFYIIALFKSVNSWIICQEPSSLLFIQLVSPFKILEHFNDFFGIG